MTTEQTTITAQLKALHQQALAENWTLGEMKAAADALPEAELEPHLDHRPFGIERGYRNLDVAIAVCLRELDLDEPAPDLRDHKLQSPDCIFTVSEYPESYSRYQVYVGAGGGTARAAFGKMRSGNCCFLTPSVEARVQLIAETPIHLRDGAHNIRQLSRAQAVTLVGEALTRAAEQAAGEPTGAYGFRGPEHGDEYMEWGALARAEFEGKTVYLTAYTYAGEDEDAWHSQQPRFGAEFD